ncbi:MAG: 6-bladed beta-propeller [Gemmatimonadales bacterium]
MIRVKVIAVASATIIACSAGPDRAGPTVATRDSASVRIVESAAPAWRPGDEWRIDSLPLLDIGSADGEEPYLFDYVETAIRLGDGTLVVANASTGQLRFFDARGRHVRSVGRRGQGPGEFGQSTVHIWRSFDGGIVAEDAGNRRVIVFDSVGSVLENVTLVTPPGGERPSIQGVLADGSWLVRAGQTGEPGADGQVKQRVQYHRYQPDGRQVAKLAEVPGPVHMVVSVGRFRTWFEVPFSAAPFAAPQGREVLLNAGGATQLDRLDASGRLLASYRWTAPRRKTADLYDRYRREELATSDTTFRRVLEAFYARSLPIEEYAPGYVRMVVDHGGNAWLQRYYLTAETERLNDVIAPDGRWLGTVRLPAGSWLMEAGADFVLLWKRDDLGVEHVMLNRLRRDPRS